MKSQICGAHRKAIFFPPSSDSRWLSPPACLAPPMLRSSSDCVLMKKKKWIKYYHNLRGTSRGLIRIRTRSWKGQRGAGDGARYCSLTSGSDALATAVNYSGICAGLQKRSTVPQQKRHSARGTWLPGPGELASGRWMGAAPPESMASVGKVMMSPRMYFQGSALLLLALSPS